jgi:2-iminobutanoate/2-iminopropanoate deaminase
MRHATPVLTEKAPRPSGAYSQAVVAPPFVFLSGQGPFDAAKNLVEGGIEAELRAVMANLKAVAEAVGCSLQDAVRFGVYLRDLADMPTVNQVFEEMLSPPFPARTTIQSDLTRFRVEADCVLYAPDLK